MTTYCQCGSIDFTNHDESSYEAPRAIHWVDRPCESNPPPPIDAASLRAEIARLTSALAAERENVAALLHQSEEVRRDRDALRAEVEKLSAQVEKLSAQVEKLSAQVKKWEAHYDRETAEMDATERKRDEERLAAESALSAASPSTVIFCSCTWTADFADHGEARRGPHHREGCPMRALLAEVRALRVASGGGDDGTVTACDACGGPFYQGARGWPTWQFGDGWSHKIHERCSGTTPPPEWPRCTARHTFGSDVEGGDIILRVDGRLVCRVSAKEFFAASARSTPSPSTKTCGQCAFRDAGSWQCTRLQIVTSADREACEDFTPSTKGET
jgi:cell division protein FtsB